MQIDLWAVAADGKPSKLSDANVSEEKLEDMIVAEPRLFSPDDEWILIGRQERTSTGGRVDLVGLTRDGVPVVIELKKGLSSRDVTAQILEYASWAQELTLDNFCEMYRRFTEKEHGVAKDLLVEFRQKFKEDLKKENDGEHDPQLIIIASTFDPVTEKIVAYLKKQEIPINILDFHVFSHGDKKILSRTWLYDPAFLQIESGSASEKSEPWNGEFYCTFGDDETRSWEDARKYGFISAGGGAWYSRTLKVLKPDDRVWVKLAWGGGYVGVGRVVGTAVPASEFRVSDEERFIDLATTCHYHREYLNDPDRCEYFVPMEWIQTFPKEQQISSAGLFGNQNSICRPRTKKWRETVDVLRKHFDKVPCER